MYVRSGSNLYLTFSSSFLRGKYFLSLQSVVCIQALETLPVLETVLKWESKQQNRMEAKCKDGRTLPEQWSGQHRVLIHTGPTGDV